MRAKKLKPTAQTIDEWFAAQDKAVDETHEAMRTQGAMMTPEKRDYIHGLAMSAARGDFRWDTATIEERKAAAAILRRARISIPRRQRRVAPVDPKVLEQQRIDQRIKEEELLLAKSVTIARAVYRLVGLNDNQYGKKLIELPAAILPRWFRDILSRVALPADIPDEQIPGHAMAFDDRTEKFKADLRREAGLLPLSDPSTPER